jgi:glucose/mannose transport system substrate-binding protein
MKPPASIVALLPLALVLALTPAAAAADRDATPAKLTLYHWWTAPSEAAALNALVELFGKKYPDVIVLAAPMPGGGGSRMFPIVKSLVAAKQSPDTFQMNAGYSAQVFFEAGLVSPIDDLWRDEGLEKVIPGVIREMNRFDGHYYSIPMNVHRTNLIWYNKTLLDKHGIDPATLDTWDAFFAAAKKLKAGGLAAPIQMGTTWTASHVFECIMASQGIAAYEDWVNGKIRAAGDPRIVAAFEIFGRYLTYVNADHGNLGWDVAIKRVAAGEAAFCVMGDWANGEFRFAGQKYGKDYGALPVPGTRTLFGLNVDSFQHPRGLVNETNAQRWLKLAASREGQDVFNPLKGSIPARSDGDIAKYDVYQRSAMAELKAARALYPAVAQGSPEAFNNRLGDALVAFMADGDAKKAGLALASATANSAARYTRDWKLQ